MFTNWLQGHLLPCPFKYLTGIDCPGCGFQRAVVALLKGNIYESLALYPPAIPILLTALWWLADSLYTLDKQSAVIKKTLFMITGSIILVSYIVKIVSL